MENLNFVPDDYVQNKESRRANKMYIALFAIMMLALGGTFGILKLRQRSVQANEDAVNAKLAEAQEQIKQFESLQRQRKDMIKTALMTAELIEPVPRSVLLAMLTNSLPETVSLKRIRLYQQKVSAGTSKYQNTKNGESAGQDFIDIEGVSPSDIEVASFIATLNCSPMLESVSLSQSQEYIIDKTAYRKFKLTTKLSAGYAVTEKDVNLIANNYTTELELNN